MSPTAGVPLTSSLQHKFKDKHKVSKQGVCAFVFKVIKAVVIFVNLWLFLFQYDLNKLNQQSVN